VKLLLDTHTFIWWDSNPSALSAKAQALCRDPANILMFSVVSAWEMQIKAHLGKLTLARPLAELVADQQASNGMAVLEITLAHVLALDPLPAVHRDPFDRLPVAQANAEGAALLSRDPIFR
jgi:PIN domain nuclease of toxin-antitoxin system